MSAGCGSRHPSSSLTASPGATGRLGGALGVLRRLGLFGWMVGMVAATGAWAGEPTAGVTASNDTARHALWSVAARAFDDAALRINDSTPAEPARWTHAIFVAVDRGGDLRPHAAQIIAAVAQLGAIAGVAVVAVESDDPRRNFLVRQADPAGRAACRAAVYSQAGHIVRVDIDIFLGGRGSLTRCINHEVLHGFGFRSHAQQAPSILSYRATDQTQISDVDRILLQTLYDPALRPAMPIAQATVVACAIIGRKLGVAGPTADAACADRLPPDGRVAFFGRRTAAAPAP